MGLTNFITTRLGFKSQLLAFVIVAFSLLSVSHVAEAKRFGGGKSFGFQKQVAPKQYNQTPSKHAAAPAKNTTTAKPAPAANSGASKWLGPLAGIAAGGLLAAMLFGDGFEGLQLFDILLFALIAFVLFKLLRHRVTSQQQAAYEGMQRQEQRDYRNADTYSNVQTRQSKSEAPAYQPEVQGSIFGADLEDGLGQGTSANAHYFDEIPSWFDEAQFVEGAKSHFIALQKAWDEVDLNEIKSYCTESLYSALELELQGVQPGDNQTRVDELNAEMAAIAVDGEFLVVSIRFTGFIEEDAHGAHAFNEVWHIRRLANDEGNWRVAGIQQQSHMA